MESHDDGVKYAPNPLPKLSEWDAFYLRICAVVASKSKDPSTKVGACIVRPDMTMASFGYNGFPRGVVDSAQRYADKAEKYPRVVHAELNAILNARSSVHGCTLYVSPLYPCATCAGAIIQAGIKEVVYSMPGIRPDWASSFACAESMFSEAGVKVRHIGQEK